MASYYNHFLKKCRNVWILLIDLHIYKPKVRSNFTVPSKAIYHEKKEPYVAKPFIQVFVIRSKSTLANTVWLLNLIIWLMGSNWPRLNKHQMSLNSILCKRNIFRYCYHSVKRIRYGRAQSDILLRRVHCTVIHVTVLFWETKVKFVLANK